MGQYLKDIAGTADHVLGSFPMTVCDNVRISRCKW